MFNVCGDGDTILYWNYKKYRCNILYYYNYLYIK